ncbi:MAG: DUF4012 domain-containing protein [Actinomycetota bacterium]|nr:DUF4012 domain-containing protein [Actinomycetota bacterium]
MKRRFVIGLLGLVAVISALTIYVVVRTSPQISAAREILSGNITSLRSSDIALAEKHLNAAHDDLHGLAANILRVVPLERQNLDAVRNGVDKSLPVLASARALQGSITQLQQGGLVRSGKVPTAAIHLLQRPLTSAASSVRSLVETLRNERSGWLIPSIWDGVNSSLAKAEELQGVTGRGSDIAAVAPDLLGANGPRRYLVLLVNNAEVRPSGGIVSGIGLLTLDRGHIRLGAFHYYTDLAQRPYQRVAAPPDFERRYRRFNADTTRWVNVTLSPDTEEVATVAARLYQSTAGKTTDGALIVDPRGVAALLPPGTHVRVPGTHQELTAAGLPRYVYSNAYRQLGGHTTVRHDALIAIGRAAFAGLRTAGLGGRGPLAAAGNAVSGGHVRMISFHPAEEAVLRRAGVTGALRADTEDRVFVTETNFNGTKLDFWSHRTIDHTCDIRSRGLTLCETTVAVKNSAPPGLSKYVAGVHPYGQIRSLLEVYLPDNAILQKVVLDGQPATFARQGEDGLRSVAVEVRVDPGNTGHLLVDYALPPNPQGYSLTVTPQPLAHDADLRLTLRIPEGWSLSGATSHRDLQSLVYDQSGHLSYPQTITVTPNAVRGISSVWQTIDNFWHGPVF